MAAPTPYARLGERVSRVSTIEFFAGPKRSATTPHSAKSAPHTKSPSGNGDSASGPMRRLRRNRGTNERLGHVPRQVRQRPIGQNRREERGHLAETAPHLHLDELRWPSRNRGRLRGRARCSRPGRTNRDKRRSEARRARDRAPPARCLRERAVHAAAMCGALRASSIERLPPTRHCKTKVGGRETMVETEVAPDIFHVHARRRGASETRARRGR